MTHWRALIERDFLGAWDLKGRAWNVTIERVESRGVFDAKSKADRRKCVIYFRNKDKPWIAGASQCEIIESMYGADFEKWVGKMITISPETTSVGKKKNVPCVRVKSTIPQVRTDTPGAMSEPVDPEMRRVQNEAFGREPGED